MSRSTLPPALGVGPPAELAELMRRVRFFYQPVEVWLFGSRAHGSVRPGSDWDILLVLDDAVPHVLLDPEVEWRLQRGSGVHADIVCYRQSEFAAEATIRNTLAHEVVKRGGRRLDVSAQ